MRHHFALPILSLLLLTTSSTHAASLTLTEPPDLYNESIAATTAGSLGSLGIGANTITGSVFGNSNRADLDYADYFVLTLPTGLAITSAQINITNFTYGGGDIYGAPSIKDHGTTYNFIGNGLYTLYPSATPGDFLVAIHTADSISVSPPNTINYFDGGFNYTLTYNVAAAPNPVPLPSALGLGATTLPLAIATLLLHRRRHQRA